MNFLAHLFLKDQDFTFEGKINSPYTSCVHLILIKNWRGWLQIKFQIHMAVGEMAGDHMTMNNLSQHHLWLI